MAKKVLIDFRICDKCENEFCKMELRKHIASFTSFAALKKFMDGAITKEDCIYHLEHALQTPEEGKVVCERREGN